MFYMTSKELILVSIYAVKEAKFGFCSIRLENIFLMYPKKEQLPLNFTIDGFNIANQNRVYERSGQTDRL